MQPTVLLLGATGRTGGRVLEQLVGRGVNVRAIVRSAARLPAAVTGRSNLTVIESEIVSMSDDDLMTQVRGCAAVISCLGHVISLKGVYGAPRDLVTKVVKRVCAAVEVLKPSAPVRFILMSSVSVNHPDSLDTRRGSLEKAVVWLLRALLPPARDNQRATDFLYGKYGDSHPFVQWVSVRPDTLLHGEVTEYTVHEHLVSGLAKPDSSSMANVAHFMCELATNEEVWERWRGKLPVIINAK